MRSLCCLCLLFITACVPATNQANLALIQAGDTNMTCDDLSLNISHLNTQLGSTYQDIKRRNYTTSHKSRTSNAIEYDARNAVNREMNRAAARTGSSILGSFSRTGSTIVGDLISGGNTNQQRQAKAQQTLGHYDTLRSRYLRLGSIAKDKDCKYITIEDYPSLKEL